MRKIKFGNDQFYHVYNRGADKRGVFYSDCDREKFIFGLDKYRFSNCLDELVEIHAYCLMDNHFHLLIRQKSDGGVSRFMHRLCSDYALYFNKINKRSGYLFEGRFKAKFINEDGYLYQIFRYIHLNPLKYFNPNWKIGGVNDMNSALNYLNKYKWSSMNVGFCDKETFLTRGVIESEFGDSVSYQNFWRKVQIWGGNLVIFHKISFNLSCVGATLEANNIECKTRSFCFLERPL